ncbi:MAG: restriction endonuclease subunit S [Ignavibacteriaceae bacterium]|jgi:type I restriction enzyme S subunit|nr:restriction endonuclease subunit S [Ignavibacteriaceae bacterium]
MNNLPSNWQVKSLGGVLASLESGGRPKGGGLSAGDIPSLGAEHLNDQGRFKFDSMKFVPKDYFNSMQRGIVNINDILVVKDGATTGKVSLVKNDFPFEQAAINEHLFLIRTNREILHPFFAFYFLYSSVGNSQIMTDFRGSAQGGISREFVNKVKIPLPPLPIQKQIAEILEKADQAKQKRKEANKLTDEFLQSVFIEMFGDPVKNPKGWEVGKLDKICIINPRSSELNFVSNNLKVTFVPMAAVSEAEGKIDRYEAKEIGEVKSGFTYFKEDDILFAKITPCMENGKCAIAKNLLNGIGFGSTEFHVIRPNNTLLKNYIHFTFRNPLVRKEAARHFTGSAGQQRVPTHYIQNFLIPIPPVSLQQQFAEIVNKTEALKKKQKQSEQELENLFQSLMQKAFKGELVS